MVLSRLQINIVLACIVAALGLAVIASYRSGRLHEVHGHPDVDASARIATLQRLIDREPGNPDYLARMGNLYYDLGQYDQAREFYQRSLDIRPHDPHVETDMATCFHYLGQHDRSLQILDNVLSYRPDFAQARFNKGFVLIEGKGDKESGIAVWEDLLRSDPSFSQRAELQQRIDNLKASAR